MEILGLDIHIPILFLLLLIISIGAYFLIRKYKLREKLITNRFQEVNKKLEKENRLFHTLQDQINEISRIETIDELIEKSLEHLESQFGFDYATLNLVAYNESIFQSSKFNDNLKLNQLTCFCNDTSLAENWRLLSRYDLHRSTLNKFTNEDIEKKREKPNDILLQLYLNKSKEAIQVIGNNVTSNSSINESHLNPKIKSKVFLDGNNLEFKHSDLARIFIPILHRNIYKGKKERNEKDNYDDSALGVIEVGINLNTHDISKSEIFIDDLFTSEVINRLFLYADNFAQLYYKISLSKTLVSIREKLAIEKISDPNFCLRVIEYLKKEFGIHFGNISEIDIGNNLQFLNKNRDIFCESYMKNKTWNTLDFNLINDQVRNNYKKPHARKIGICNAVIQLYSDTKRNSNQNNFKIEKSIIVENDISDKESHSYILLEDIRSEIGIPIFSPENNILGVCILSSKHKNFFTKYHVKALSYFGKLLGTRLLTVKRYSSISSITEPLNLFVESDITSRLVREVQKYFGTEDVVIWNRKEDNFFPCYDTLNYVSSGRIKVSKVTSFGNSDFPVIDKDTKPVNLDFINENEDMPILVRKIKQLKNGHLKTLGKGFSRIILLRFTNNQKYDRVITIFSKRSVSQEATNEYADEFALSLRERIEDALQINSLFNLLTNYRSLERLNIYKLLGNEIIKYTKADVVGIIPILNDRSLDINSAVVLGESWEFSKNKTFSLSKMILVNGSEIFNSLEEINHYYERHTGDGIPKDDFINQLNSVACLRLKVELDNSTTYPAILMIEYLDSNKFKEGDKHEKYVKSLKRVLGQIIWSYNQISSNFQRLNEFIVAKNESIKKLDFKSKEIEIKLKELTEANMQLKMLGASAAYFDLFHVLNHEILNYFHELDVHLTSKGIKTKRVNEIEEIIENLLELFNTGKTTAESFDLNKMIKSLVRILENSYKSIKFITNDLGDIPKIEWNKAQFGIILFNLTNNAIYALNKSTRAKKEIIYETKYADSSLIIKIRDNGIGISNNHLDKIFDLNYTTKGNEGHGIGLNFIKNALSGQTGDFTKGEITVVSTKNKFTEFTITIPQF